MRENTKRPASKNLLNELDPDRLGGHDIQEVRCRACSGYGACGFKSFMMYDGKPVSVCNLALGKIEEENLDEDEGSRESGSESKVGNRDGSGAGVERGSRESESRIRTESGVGS